MKKLLFWLIMGLVSLLCSDAHAQSYLPTITSTACLGNGAGDVIASGNLIVVGTDQNDNPITYRVNGTAQAVTSAISRPIVNGQLSVALQLANPALTSPVGVLYRIAIQDNSTKKITLYKQVIIAANSGSNYDLCIANLTPSTAAVTTVTNPGTVNGNTVQNGDFTVNGRFVTTMQTITFSATPTFDCSLVAGGSFFKLTLTANVTSSTLSNCSNGQRIVLELCQDATGSRTFVAPTNIQSFVTIPATASTCTAQFFIFDGGISKAVPDSVPVPLVSILNGVSYPASPSTHGVPVVTAANTVTYKVVPDCTDTTGNHLNYTQSTDTWSCGVSTNAINGQGAVSAITGNATDQTVYTFSIGANTASNTSQGVLVSCGLTHTSGTASALTKININGVTAVSGNIGTTASQSVTMQAKIMFKTSTTAGVIGMATSAGNMVPFTQGIAGLAWTGSQTITCTTNEAATDTVSGVEFVIEAIK